MQGRSTWVPDVCQGDGYVGRRLPVRRQRAVNVGRPVRKAEVILVDADGGSGEEKLLAAQQVAQQGHFLFTKHYGDNKNLST